MKEEDGWELGRQVNYFNGTLRKLRLKRGLVQKDVAKAVGVKPITISSYETMRSMPSKEVMKKIIDIICKPLEYDLPQWVVNRKKDPKDGSYTQQVANGWDTKIREDLEKMKKIKLHKGLRHYFGLKVRGQHTNSTGRRGKTVGVSRTKG